MKIYNEEKTQILENVDLTLGRLKPDTITISEEQQEEFHYEEKHYDNGGVAKYRVIDKPYKEAELEQIEVYVLYTEDELRENKIEELKQNLYNTDYIDNKLTEAIAEFIETGDNSKILWLKQEYSKELTDRKLWREEINRLEEELQNG